jgi:hypothetical protein
MKVIFLDIDGVLNCATTRERFRGAVGIDGQLLHRFKMILNQTAAEVVLSSTWRLFPDMRDELRLLGVKIKDITPDNKGGLRGDEIAKWLWDHPEVSTYAILDDDSDMLAEQLPNFFKTTWEKGLTGKVAREVIKHLNGNQNSNF